MDHTAPHPTPAPSGPEPPRTAIAAPAHDAERNRELGAQGEELAAQYLVSLGYRLLERNWRHGRAGELDLVMSDGQTVVAVEVKTRRGTGYGHPLEAITVAKASRLRRLLLAWVRDRRPRAARLRVDAVGIVLSPTDEPRITHLRGIA